MIFLGGFMKEKPIKTILKVDRMASASGLSRNEVASAILDRGTAHIELTDEDLAKFEEEVRRNRDARMHS